MARRQLLALVFCAVHAAPLAAESIGDPTRGATLFDRQCKACHQIGAGATNRVGPVLSNLFGRKAGAVPDFKYSKPLTRMGADGLIWTLQTLDAYIENPKALVSGTRMNYRGMADATARADLIAFLRDYSDQPQNIPESEPTARKTAPALDPAILAIEGDPEYGAYLSSECSTCHRRDGTDDGIPSITQWPPEDFVVAMHAYKAKLRPHPVMQMMASRLSNDEIAALAAYFATLE
ncbi:c-type cytochrome [Pseudotabrizicola alkalilacus]|uniref:Cytochrome C n=1 Tax=Pseudotabrizicola alkalilacus TaxID=2305252 RepID=A0A411Z233_9RHOB|nr:c-type cytochrome [Pseudotabrizicola alkalilacus]RGP37123.1 cytochrome C [Pseudotabrizicola alkalilacus]